jgi:hypothetical protein
VDFILQSGRVGIRHNTFSDSGAIAIDSGTNTDRARCAIVKTTRAIQVRVNAVIVCCVNVVAFRSVERLRTIHLLATSLAAAATILSGQTFAASITGTVTDTTSAVVPRTRISVTDPTAYSSADETAAALKAWVEGGQRPAKAED